MKHLTLLVGCLIFLTASSAQSIAQQRTDTGVSSISVTSAEPIEITTFALNAGKGLPNRKAL